MEIGALQMIQQTRVGGQEFRPSIFDSGDWNISSSAKQQPHPAQATVDVWGHQDPAGLIKPPQYAAVSWDELRCSCLQIPIIQSL